jgi:16S rRNA processing protein RimM
MVVMGRVAAPFAVLGWLKVQVYTQARDGLLSYPVWWLEREGGWKEVDVEDAAVHGVVLIAKLKGCDSREDAVQLRGCRVGVPRRCLPPSEQGEYYLADLEGLRVRNLQGAPLGRVSAVLETGANAVLVVEGERERLIPLVDAVVMSVDLAAGEVVVDWGVDY